MRSTPTVHLWAAASERRYTEGHTIKEHAITATDLRHGVQALRLSGRPLCIHASLRSFGHVVGGADTVLDSLLDEGCTVMVPAFTDAFLAAPPPDAMLERNGGDDPDAPAVEIPDRRYDPGSTLIGPEMGAIPAALIHRPERVRGIHPFNSFAAIGPLAGALIEGQQPLDVYAPFRALIDHGGFVLLMGVGLTSMTLLHMAEARAGRRLFRHWAWGGRGQLVEGEAGGCSLGFDSFEPFVAPLAREVCVGESRWRSFDPAAVLSAASAAIRDEPDITRCTIPGCIRCADAIAGGPILP